MNPDHCETRERGIEWEFLEGDLALVAHVPVEGNMFAAVRLDEPGAELSGKSLAITRALLHHALEVLSEAETRRRMNDLLGESQAVSR